MRKRTLESTDNLSKRMAESLNKISNSLETELSYTKVNNLLKENKILYCSQLLSFLVINQFMIKKNISTSSIYKLVKKPIYYKVLIPFYEEMRKKTNEKYKKANIGDEINKGDEIINEKTKNTVDFIVLKELIMKGVDDAIVKKIMNFN